MSNTYQQLGTRIGGLVDRKRASYGLSLDAAADFLQLLYPDGIPTGQTVYALLFARTFEKMARFVADPDAFGESPFDDMVGHCLLGAHHYELQRSSKGCGSVSAAVAGEESKAHASSAAPSAVPQTTPTENEKSASSSRLPSSSPSQPTSASTAAPAQIATVTAFANVADPGNQRAFRYCSLPQNSDLWRERNRLRTCAACGGELDGLRAYIRINREDIACCSQGCRQYLLLNQRLA